MKQWKVTTLFWLNLLVVLWALGLAIALLFHIHEPFTGDGLAAFKWVGGYVTCFVTGAVTGLMLVTAASTRGAGPTVTA